MESKRLPKKRDALEEAPETESSRLNSDNTITQEGSENTKTKRKNENEIEKNTTETTNIFNVDHSIRGTAKCLVCKKKNCER